MSLVEGATLGLVGFGAVGKVLAAKALALGMRVISVRRTASPLPAGVERAPDLTALFAQSDHVVLACPATPETNGLIGADVLKHAKPFLHLVNVARGSLIDENALLDALDTKRLSAATLDCAHPEPLPAGHPFYTHPKIRLSPHTSPMVPDFHKNILATFVGNFEKYRAGVSPENIVDPAAGY